MSVYYLANTKELDELSFVDCIELHFKMVYDFYIRAFTFVAHHCSASTILLVLAIFLSFVLHLAEFSVASCL